MIYIPFFIVILIDKRGVREAERERKARTQVRIQIRIQIRIQHRAATAQRKRGIRRAERKKRYEPAPHTIPPHSATPHRLHHHTTQRLHSAYTAPTGTHTHAHPPTPAYKNVHARLHRRTHRRTHRRARAQAPTGACRRGLGERHPSVTTPETTCDHQPYSEHQP